jgi:branched-chain amino acid transport system permease protein
MGSLYAHYEGFVTPGLAAFPKSVQLVTMVVVGGMASIWGSVLGAALLSLAPELLARFEGYETLAFGAILVATMIFLPRGIAPSLSARFRRKES